MIDTERGKRQAIKRKLGLYKLLKQEQEQIEETINRMDAEMTAPRIQTLDGMPKGSSSEDPMLNYVIKREELMDKYREKCTQLIEEQAELETMIDNLEPTERQLARYRYLDGMTWEEVCVAMNYSWRQTHRIHSRLIGRLAGCGHDDFSATEKGKKNERF